MQVLKGECRAVFLKEQPRGCHTDRLPVVLSNQNNRVILITTVQ
jgi:hypothetical protein